MSESGAPPSKDPAATTVVGSASHPVEAQANTQASGRHPVLVDEGEIGAGGSSVIRRMFDPTLRRRIAMKVLSERLAQNPRSLATFVQEAEITAQLEHPNIVPIHELCADPAGNTYFTMRLVRGRTLFETARACFSQLNDAETLRRVLGIFLKVCDAVAFAHSRGVLHCDIKPENVMVGEYGEVYLMDWGIACLTATRAREPEGAVSLSADRRPKSGVRGTPAYMSPEQAHGQVEAFDERTDVFGLGASLYCLLTGKPPFESPTVQESLARARATAFPGLETLTRASAAGTLGRIVRKAMAPQPADRHASVLELQREVELYLRGGAHFPTKIFPAGTLIVREGDEADAAYIIARGHCRVTKTVDGQTIEIRTLGPEAVFGETAIFAGSVRTASVQAIDDVTVKVVTRALIEEQLGFDSWLGRFVLAVADRFREVDERLTRITRES